MKLRKTVSAIVAAVMFVSLTACAGERTEELPESAQESAAASGQEASGVMTESEDAGTEASDRSRLGSNILVAYFSWADNAILADDVDTVASSSVIAPGNVQQLAGWVQEETGGDLFSIRVTDPYPSDWDACLSRANEERGDDARPELEENVTNLEQYDTVFLGYPNWWYGVPMALLSFLEQNDLSGKQVYLFCSHGTGGLANSVEIITQAAPGAILSDQIFDCYEEDAAGSEEEIRSWVEGLGLSKKEGTDGQENAGQQNAGQQAVAQEEQEQEEQTQEEQMQEEGEQPRRISVQFGDNTVIYELNDGTAADSLYAQLPLTIEVEDYSTNEKIFYPPQELDTADSPLAASGAGTLAYYAPWGDVVMFYGDYSENASLYELGQAVSGAELVGQMMGTVIIDVEEGQE